MADQSVAVPKTSDISDTALKGVVDAKRLQMSNPVASPTHKIPQSVEQSPSYNSATGEISGSISAMKDSGLIIFVLAFLGLALYLACYFWRKQRCRNMVALSKGCQYSRLNQIETDEIDSVAFCSGPSQVACNVQRESSWEENDNCKPATLEVTTDSLITTSNYSSHTPNGCAKFDHSIVSVASDLSDEDLLQ